MEREFVVHVSNEDVAKSSSEKRSRSVHVACGELDTARALVGRRRRQNGAVTAVVLIVGRVSADAAGVRDAAFAAGQKYFRAVERGGGVPLLLPPMPALLDRLPAVLDRVDAVVLHGGGDVDPTRYGQAQAAEQVYGIVHEHDEVEIAVTRAAIERDLPLLGICRGMQVLNVAMGGTLVQHIGSEDHWRVRHPVTLEPGTRIAKAVGADVADSCNSIHHQALDTIADGLAVVGRGSDGMVEAVEAVDSRWIVAVQWHPEDTADEDPQQQSIFDELVRQAAP
jgi:putative glutamine amidotransferase